MMRVVLLALTGVLAIAAPAAAAPVTTLEPGYEVVKEENVVVPMTDGTRLVADVYRPAPKDGQPAGQRFPCLFEMTPYRKEMRAAEAAGFFPARGFVYMEVDARGTGGSEGEYDGVFLDQEQRDGYDAIEWLATRYPHCDGRVGMFGGSYSGINQYLIAASPKGTPPHLRTIAPQRALTDLYRDIVHTGGIVTGSFGVLWSGGTTAYNAIGADPRTSPDPELAVNALVHHLGNDPMLLTYLNRPFDSPFYRASSVIDRLDRLDLPILHLEGWYDAFTRGQLQAIGRLLDLERDGVVSGPNHAVVGPWNHSGSHFLDHQPFDRRLLEWYRHWLDDGPRPDWFDGPRIVMCLMRESLDGACDWRGSDRWPLAETRWTPLHLAAEGRLQESEPPPGEVGAWTWNPLAGTGEAAFSKWDNAAGAPQREADQSVEDEPKGATFTTAPLASDLDLVGPIALHLEAAVEPLAGPALGLPQGSLAALPGLEQLRPDRLDADIVVKLSEVAPGGRSTLIQTGFLRASHRALDPSRTTVVDGEVVVPTHFHDEAHLAGLEPGRRTAFDIEVWPTAKRFRAGHRLRIALYSADTPNHVTQLAPVRVHVLDGSRLLVPTGGRLAAPGLG